MAMDDEMQTFRQKTGRKSGCHGCKYADWDADGATCSKLGGMHVWNPAKGCKYRKERSVTNGDRIRSMTDEELAEWLDCETETGCNVCSKHPTQCDVDCYSGYLEWLRKEAEP